MSFTLTQAAQMNRCCENSPGISFCALHTWLSLSVLLDTGAWSRLLTWANRKQQCHERTHSSVWVCWPCLSQEKGFSKIHDLFLGFSVIAGTSRKSPKIKNIIVLAGQRTNMVVEGRGGPSILLKYNGYKCETPVSLNYCLLRHFSESISANSYPILTPL